MKSRLAALPLLACTLATAGASALLATPSASAAPHDLYVSPSGSDSHAGTASSPFRQVNRAAQVAGPGTVVHVAPGSYGPVTSYRSGTASAPITFVSSSRWRATINGGGRTSAWSNSGNYVRIYRFNITGAQYNGVLTTASHGQVLGNHIHHLSPPNCSRGGGGVVAENYSSVDNAVVGNRIDHILVSGDCARIHGIYLQSPHAGKIMNNLVYQTSGWGIHLWHNARYITIANNTVFQNRKGGIVVGGSLEGNDQSPGIATGVVVSNNIAAFNGDDGIREMGRVGRNTYTNNLVYGNRAGGFSLISGSRPTGTVSASPQFVRYAADGSGDYRLRRTSPAVDRGNNRVAAPNDMRLVRRPVHRVVDIGAYEGGF